MSRHRWENNCEFTRISPLSYSINTERENKRRGLCRSEDMYKHGTKVFNRI